MREGKEPVKPNSDLSYAANFLYMLKGELPSDTEVEAFNKALILHAIMNLMLQHLQQDAQYHLYLICIQVL